MIDNVLLRRDIQVARLRPCVRESNFLMQLCIEMEKLGDRLDQRCLTRNFFAIYNLLVCHCEGAPPRKIMSVFDSTPFSPSLDALVLLYNSNMPQTSELDGHLVGNGGLPAFFVPNSRESVQGAFKYGLRHIKVDIYWSEMDRAFFTTHQKMTVDEILSLSGGNTVTFHWMAKSFDGEDAAQLLHKLLAGSPVSTNLLCGNEFAIREIRRHSVTLPLGYITSNIHEDCFRSLIDAHSLSAVCLDYTTVCPMVVEKIHGMGCKVFCTGAESTNEKLYLKACDVDYMITDFPLKGRC